MLLVTPPLDAEPWPTLGPQVCDFIEDHGIYGPGSLQGNPYEIDPEFRAWLYRCYEVYPQGHEWAGRRRFKRAGMSVRKGLAKTEREALVVFAELHAEGPVRCDGFDAAGQPVGRPVRSPYIPMLAYSVNQVEELAYGALRYIVENGPDADLFDVSLERIMRLDERGREDGKAVPLAQSPNARDGARTTLNAYDEPHRLYLPRMKQAHATMEANLPKRPLESPWSLYVGTAGEPGQGSVAEDLHREAEKAAAGTLLRPDLFYLYRTDDDPDRDLTDKAERIQAIREATGPAGEWGPGQFDDIASQWDREGADTNYLERVWLNRWTRSNEQAFRVTRWNAELSHVDGDPAKPQRSRIPKGAAVGVGFDGARLRDSTALVVTELATGTQELWGLWEQDLDDPDWEVPADEVDQTVEQVYKYFRVWRMYGDPPYWVTELGIWAGRHKGQVVEWWTNRIKESAYAVRAYREAQASGAVGWSPEHYMAADFARHIGNAGRKETKILDDKGEPLDILAKIHKDRKFDAAMAGLLSWQAYLDAHKAGAAKPRTPSRPRRIR